MDLLDAVIALAVTLAALATTVTVVMEIFVRLLGLKSKGQIELFKKVFDRSFKNRFNGSANNFEFVKGILGNPLQDWTASPEPDSDSGDRNVLPKTTSFSDVFGGKSSCVYDWVSTEHVFRRILDLPEVINDSRDTLVQKLKEFNQEYNELCAAASTQFKNNRHRWSVLIGVAFALVMNVNGLRIFETFMDNPALTATMIAQMDELVEKSEDAKGELEKALASNGDGSIDDFNQRLEYLQAQLGELEGKGIPIGWKYPPHCNLIDWWSFRELSDTDLKPVTNCHHMQNPPAERDNNDLAKGSPGMFAAFVVTLLTGILIGLGAPFWFDLAKRLAQVRSMFKGKGTSEEMFSGESPKGRDATDGDKTDALIEKVVDEALASGKPVAARKLLVASRNI